MSLRVLALSGILAFAVAAPAMAKQFNQPARLKGGDNMLITQMEAKARAKGRQAAEDGEAVGNGVSDDIGKDIIFNNQCGDQNVGVIAEGAKAPRNLVISADAIINVCRR